MRITLTELACAAALSVFALTSHAADTEKVVKDSAKDQYKATMQQADATYKSEKDACKAKYHQ